MDAVKFSPPAALSLLHTTGISRFLRGGVHAMGHGRGARERRSVGGDMVRPSAQRAQRRANFDLYVHFGQILTVNFQSGQILR